MSKYTSRAGHDGGEVGWESTGLRGRGPDHDPSREHALGVAGLGHRRLAFPQAARVAIRRTPTQARSAVLAAGRRRGQTLESEDQVLGLWDDALTPYRAPSYRHPILASCISGETGDGAEVPWAVPSGDACASC